MNYLGSLPLPISFFPLKSVISFKISPFIGRFLCVFGVNGKGEVSSSLAEFGLLVFNIPAPRKGHEPCLNHGNLNETDENFEIFARNFWSVAEEGSDFVDSIH